MSRYILAVCLDCGDTLVDEASEVRDEHGVVVQANLIPGAADTVRGLKRRGYPLALVADGPASTFRNILTAYELFHLFDALAISEEVGVEKPAASMFTYALDQLKIAPQDYGRVVMVGNNLARDIKGANRLGLISVWLDCSPRRPKIPADKTEIPRHTIKTPGELLPLLDTLENQQKNLSPRRLDSMKIINLSTQDKPLVEQAAHLLVAAFQKNWPNAWPTLNAALTEVNECLDPERILRIAIDENGKLLGWIGALTEHNGIAWELHPLVVDPQCQGQGIGRALVNDLEEQVKQRGGISIYLGTDDENNMTSLSGKDLYANTWQHITNIQNLAGHPYEFYQKMGYTIVGVIPDANGPGKPDIIMAKRII